MERLTSDDFCSSAAEKPVSSSYYCYTRPSLNGYTNVAVVSSSSPVPDESADDSERVGVFDYVLSPSQCKDHNSGSFSSTVSTAAGEDDLSGSSYRRKWAQNTNSSVSDTRINTGTELTTFRHSGSDLCSQPANDASCRDAKTVAGNGSDLEEIVVHPQVQSQRATYERFNPDFSYPVVCRSPVHEPATVFVTSINKSCSQTSGSTIDTSDERDVLERRSHPYSPSCKCICLLIICISRCCFVCRCACIQCFGAVG